MSEQELLILPKDIPVHRNASCVCGWKGASYELRVNDWMEEVCACPVCDSELGLKLGARILNRGIRYRRVRYAPEPRPEGWVNTEKVFADEWEDTNEPRSYLNHGQGTLQNLFGHRNSWGNTWFSTLITARDRVIAATVIQWLGTNVGWCWLEMTLKKCGFRLVRKGRER